MEVINYTECPICKSKNIALNLKSKDYFFTQESFDIYKCNSCIFLFTQGIPVEKEIGKYYKSEDYVSHSDNSKGLFNKLYHISRSYMLNYKKGIIEKFTKNKPSNLLDIGSGTGYFINNMQKNNWKVFGIEISDDAREYSKKNFNLNVENTDYLFTDKLKNIDVITMWHVLEHVQDLDKYLKRLHELLNDYGWLFLALPNPNSFDAKYYKEFWGAYDVPRHLWHFTPETINNLIEKYNFKIVAKKKLPLDAFYVSILSSRYKGAAIPMISGMFVGFISYLKSLFCVGNCSSVIYVLKKS